MKKKIAIAIPQITTLEQADAHQRKHGFRPLIKDVKDLVASGRKAQAAVDTLTGFTLHQKPAVDSTDGMNKTERDFSFILEAQLRVHEIDRWLFQGITLRWRVGNKIIRYTPDFDVWPKVHSAHQHPLKFIEIKGGYHKMPGFLERAIERFRHAVTYWPQFEFEMWKREKGNQWKQLH